MGLMRVAAVMVAVGLMSSPVTALYCSDDSPAAKALRRERRFDLQPARQDGRLLPRDARGGQQPKPAARWQG